MTTAFFFNTRTGTVEELETKGPSKDLLGPYPTREAAQAALSTAAARTEDWDAKERAWRDDD
ncbi:MAG TPA: hypothetical protein VF661_06255 [Actinomycetales bacterium]|jgi:hypothetical protein